MPKPRYWSLGSGFNDLSGGTAIDLIGSDEVPIIADAREKYHAPTDKTKIIPRARRTADCFGKADRGADFATSISFSRGETSTASSSSTVTLTAQVLSITETGSP